MANRLYPATPNALFPGKETRMKAMQASTTLTLMAAIVAVATSPLPCQAGKLKAVTENPDLTSPNPKLPTQLLDYALGSTGAFGWMFHDADYDYTGVTQILIHKVTPGTPADGKLQNGDVLLGAGAGAHAKAFVDCARDELAAALLAAEDEKIGGQLTLQVWRQGKTQEVQLTLPTVKGAYDPEHPLTCERAQTLIQDMASTIEKRGLRGDWLGVFDGLGLLATGDARYHPMLKQYAHSLAPKEALDLNNRSKQGWSWGYTSLFLAEYYGATGDKSILPILEEYATKLAMGQGYAGTWNHTLANPDLHENGGKLHGRLGGYGAINQTSVICAIALVVTKKVGVDNQEISDAIQRSKEHFEFYVDKGGIPYGDDPPTTAHSSNGKNAGCAVLMDLLGNEKGGRFFSRMTLASYPRREGGHTGHFFGQLWGGMGAACAGDEAANAFAKALQPYLQLERRSGGECFYQPMMNAEPGKYMGWSLNGARLLQYCAPRKALHITGKSRATPPLVGQELAETMKAETMNITKEMSVDELLALLGSWSPVVRERAAVALGEKDVDVVDRLIALLDSENRFARCGACKALQLAGRGSEKAVDALIAKALKSEDSNLRYFAVQAFAVPRIWDSNTKSWIYPPNGLGKAAAKAVEPLLELALLKDPADPRKKIQYIVAGVLFYDGNAAKTIGQLSKMGSGDYKSINRDLLLAATREIIKNQNGRARNLVADAVYPRLTKEELLSLREDIVTGVRVRAPSGVGGGYEVRSEGIKLLASVHDPMVPELCNQFLMNWDKIGVEIPIDFVEPLFAYGKEAQVALPGLRIFHERKQQSLEFMEMATRGKNMTTKSSAQLAERRKEVEFLKEAIRRIEGA